LVNKILSDEIKKIINKKKQKKSFNNANKFNQENDKKKQ
jgi:hypothetical protein